MFFSFLTRFIPSPKKQPVFNTADENTSLKIFAIKEGGKFFHDFKLFHQKTITVIDTLIFLPHFGIFVGETLDWKASELENSTIERATRQSKRPATTHLETMESKIRSKLQDVLSFDSTPVHRFIWMKNLTESEFDGLDISFHELLPKNRILFANESVDSIRNKLHSIGEYLNTPLSGIKIIGTLQSYTFIMPSSQNPAGALLSPHENYFLSVPLSGQTTLFGEYGSGKSTLLIRKAMYMLLTNPEEQILVIAPTLLASEILRNEFVSLMYYGALSIDLTRITFAPPPADLETFKPFHEATAVLCDDVYRMEQSFIETLKQKRGNRIYLLTSTTKGPASETNVPLPYSYQKSITPLQLRCDEENLLSLLLSELRKHLMEGNLKDVLIIFPDPELLSLFKEPIDEYLHLNSRVLTLNFSLQTQDLDDLVMATTDCISGIYAPHLFLLTSDDTQDYTYPLSRASETATIISYSKS